MDWSEYLNQQLTETLKKKVVIRNSKKVYKWVSSDPDKYDVVRDKNGNFHEVPRDKALDKKKSLIAKVVQKTAKSKGKAKRAASFKARERVGLEYNKEMPDIVRSRGPGGHVPGGPMKEATLNEAPHSYLYSDDAGDHIWDFYAEIRNDCSWLLDVVSIYQDRKLMTQDGGAQENEELLDIPEEALPEITDNLMYNIEFLLIAAKDFVRAPMDIKNKFKNGIPVKLFDALKPYIDKMQRKTPLSDYQDDNK